jgi:hypothetical protein
MVEGRAISNRNRNESLTQPLLLHLERAVMAIRVIASPTKEYVRCPGATAFADRAIVATATIAP